MLSPMIRRLAHTKAVKIAVIRKLISLRNRCTYPLQSTRKEENLKFVKSWYRSRPFCEVLQDNFCRRLSLYKSVQMNPCNNATSRAQSAMSLSLQK